MPTTTRRHSVHVHAPIPVVFKYIQDPVLAYSTMLGPEIIDVDAKPEGVGTTWKSVAPPMMGLCFAWGFTREDQVVDASITDKSSTGVAWTWTLHPGHVDDTELSLEMDFSNPVPMLDKVVMITIGRHTDEEMLQALTAIKMAIEA